MGRKAQIRYHRKIGNVHIIQYGKNHIRLTPCDIDEVIQRCRNGAAVGNRTMKVFCARPGDDRYIQVGGEGLKLVSVPVLSIFRILERKKIIKKKG